MNTRMIRKATVGLAVLSCAVTGDFASAQLLRPRPRYLQPAVQPAQPNQVPSQPAPGDPAQATAIQGGSVQTGQIPPANSAQIIRGSQIVGLSIMDPQSQKLGVIKEILIDSQTGRVAYVLLASEGSDANAEWVVVPFEALQMSGNGANQQQYFILNIQAAQLRTAPHIRSEAWESVRDPRFMGQIQQFYRATERTARRPAGQVNADVQDAQPATVPQSRGNNSEKGPSAPDVFKGEEGAAKQPLPSTDRSATGREALPKDSSHKQMDSQSPSPSTR
jgi:hypothetical protein